MKKLTNKQKSILNITLLLCLTILVLYISLKDNFFEVLKSFAKLNPFWILIALIFVFGYNFLRSLSLHIFVKKFKPDISLFEIMKLGLITQFFDGITPSSTGGQPYQIYAFNKQKINIIDSTNITIQNFIVYQIALILLGLIAVISNNYLNLFSELGTIKKLIMLGFIINVMVIVSLFTLAFVKRVSKVILNYCIKLLYKLRIIKNKEKITKNINEYIEKFHKSALTLLKNKRQFIKTIFFNLIALMLYYSIPIIIIYGLGIYDKINLLETIITSAYVMLIGSFIPLPGATGGLEYAFIQFYSVFIKGPTITVVMLLWRFLTYYLGVIIGAILLNIRKK